MRTKTLQFHALKKLNIAAAFAGVVAFIFLLGGCETTAELSQVPGRMLYAQAESLENQGLHGEAITKFEQVSSENPGTRLATFGYLRVAELQTKLEKWKEAAVNYRAFLSLNPNSHLTPYVLYRLMQTNHERSFTGQIFRSREIDRDMEPNRQIILEYKRFLLLYPKNSYLKEAKPFYIAAKATLADREYLVGEFYFKKKQYHAAIGRYHYLLRNYPDYPDTRNVLEKLIQSYRRNNQPQLADEMQSIYNIRYLSSKPDSVRSPVSDHDGPPENTGRS